MELSVAPVIQHKGEKVVGDFGYVEVTQFTKGRIQLYAARRKYFGGSRLIFRSLAEAELKASQLNELAAQGQLV